MKNVDLVPYISENDFVYDPLDFNFDPNDVN